MAQAKISLEQLAPRWLDKGMDNNSIKAELQNMGIDDRNIPDLMKEIRKMRQARNTTKGLYLILAGAVCCLLSCVLTLVSSQLSVMVLYGFTTVGILIVFAGLIKIFG